MHVLLYYYFPSFCLALHTLSVIVNVFVTESDLPKEKVERGPNIIVLLFAPAVTRVLLLFQVLSSFESR